MKLKIIGICVILLGAAAVVMSQEPPAQPLQPQEPPMAQRPQRPPDGPPPRGEGHQGPQGPQPGQPMPQHAPRPGQPPRPPEPPDPIAQNLFPPEMVMQHREEIGLTDEQHNAIRQELRKASTKFNELQFQMEDEMEAMQKLTKGSTVDEQKVMAELDRVVRGDPNDKEHYPGIAGVGHTVSLAGQSLLLNANSPNFGSMNVLPT